MRGPLSVCPASIDRANRALIRKTIATQALLATADTAVEVVGGGALFRKHELERLRRDLQGMPFHPLPAKKQHAFTARVVLGMPPV